MATILNRFYLECQKQIFLKIGPSDTLETTGVCTDSFIASGTSGITTPVICGMNTGQHRK